MALGKRMREERSGWVATTDLPVSPGHRFYQKLNGLLDEAKPRRSGSARRRAVNHLQYPAVRRVQRPASAGIIEQSPSTVRRNRKKVRRPWLAPSDVVGHDEILPAQVPFTNQS
jgi:hypothetical protein